ncbi:adenylate/guanylate cyclase domain-containing protein [Polynucleobacter sp. MWH-Braz-FAM2G]|uniref:adenylate/guanylate cyclase domain-containing protein n=1 Tax=Polynucleobacter sp. MWH-Braz-FAM2G TaxID=1855883 RepID=UPI001BFDF171|nr:adenylate/guanylate cyclase domain-containing protein [Polynucleobacter sp. MWH-Braz-FAM2G]QWD90107.1 hypothetical protein FD973_07345 [Polynucleobacter sp. MWH-Braz-FAM2G]
MKKHFSLNLHISSLFLLLIFIVGGTISLISHLALEEILRKGAQEKSNRLAQQMVSNFRGLIDPSEVGVRLLANSSIAEANTLSARLSRAGLFKEIITNYSAVAAVYVGYTNGDFFLLRPIRSENDRNKYNAPAETTFMIQSIEHVGAALQGSYIFLDSSLRELKVDPQAEYPKKYFPRQRPWFQEAVKTSNVITTPPYLFFANRRAGITIAKQAVNHQAVVAIDIELDALGKNLSEQKPTPNAEMAIVDDQGFVIASSGTLSLVDESGSSGSQIQLKRLNQFNSPIFDALYQITSNKSDLPQFIKLGDVGGNSWDINFYPFSAGGDGRLMFISAVPENELLADAIALKHRLILVGLVLLLLVIPISLLLSRAISRPIRLLAKEADNIREFSLHQFRHVTSHIREISTLNIALSRLQKTIAAFTAYIPRDLVSDLLKSDTGIEISGESRYLTILFSDLKDFSSLSEVTPSRELLARVSSYLKLMTYAIKEEGGTVDKFIGDSVMAFWGAPALNPNHAYHSAVAAIKTKRRMVKLNQELVQDGKPPLVVRIGINTDAVLVGNIGSEERLSYTVMGDGVNIASRLEGINKEFGTDIAISHSVFMDAGERLWVRPIDLITVKGRAGEILIYELLGIRDGDAETAATPAEMELCVLTTEAFKFFSVGDFERAQSIYEEMVAKFNDELSKEMVKRCQKKIETKV